MQKRYIVFISGIIVILGAAWSVADKKFLTVKLDKLLFIPILVETKPV